MTAHQIRRSAHAAIVFDILSQWLVGYLSSQSIIKMSDSDRERKRTTGTFSSLRVPTESIGSGFIAIASGFLENHRMPMCSDADPPVYN